MLLFFLIPVNEESRSTSFRKGLIQASNKNDVIKILFLSVFSNPHLPPELFFLPFWFSSHCGPGNSGFTLSLLLAILKKNEFFFFQYFLQKRQNVFIGLSHITIMNQSLQPRGLGYSVQPALGHLPILGAVRMGRRWTPPHPTLWAEWKRPGYPKGRKLRWF